MKTFDKYLQESQLTSCRFITTSIAAFFTELRGIETIAIVFRSKPIENILVKIRSSIVTKTRMIMLRRWRAARRERRKVARKGLPWTTRMILHFNQWRWREAETAIVRHGRGGNQRNTMIETSKNLLLFLGLFGENTLLFIFASWKNGRSFLLRSMRRFGRLTLILKPNSDDAWR